MNDFAATFFLVNVRGQVSWPIRSRLRGSAYIARLTLALTLAFVALAPVAAASPFDLSGRDWEGATDFIALAKAELGAARVVPTGVLDLRALKREDSILLLHPEKTLDVDSLTRFMRAGGRVLLLDDYGTGDALLTHFGLERVAAPRHPAESLRNNPAFAIAEPASAHPVAADVMKVVTNHATGLKHPDLSPVLKMRAVDESDVLLAVAGAVGQGRLLAVGDPSIVMNDMLRYPGNKAFARGLVKYAGDDDTWGKRGSGKVYVVSGAFEQRGTFGDDGLGDDWHERLRNLEDALATVRRDGFSPMTAYLFAVLAGLAIVLWVGSRAARTHRAVQPRFTRALPVLAQGGVAGHAAVIGAPHTSRVLAMIELKSALEEDLCAILGLDRMPGHEALLVQLSSKNLVDTEDLRALKRILLRLANIETMVLSQGHGGGSPGVPAALRGGKAAGALAGAAGGAAAAQQPIKDREVVQTAAAIKKILRSARGRAVMKRNVEKVVAYAGGAS